MRLARERREEALELARDLKQLPATLAERCALSDDPDQVARRLRGRLQISVDAQTGWQSKYDGFNFWRAARHGSNPKWSEDELGQLARRFWVSWEVILRRLLIAGRTTKDVYDAWRRNNTDRFPEREDDGDPRLKTPIRVVRRHGRLFPGLVLEGYDESVLTAHEAAAYLNAGPQHLEEIREEVSASRFAI